jgi:hypothetical protein
MARRDARRAPSARRRLARSRDHGVDVGKLWPEQPGVRDPRAVLDEEGGAFGDVLHPTSLRRDAEGANGVPVPVGEERHVDPQRLCPRCMRPDGVSRDRQRPDPERRKIGSPVTQEADLVRSGRRPVPEVEAEERQARAENLAQALGTLPRLGPDLHVGNGIAGTEHGRTVPASAGVAETIDIRASRGKHRGMRLPIVASPVAFAVFVATAVAGAATDPNRETIRLNAADQAAARAVVLKKSDFGVPRIWTGGKTKPDFSANPTCPNYHPNLSRFVVTGAAATEWRGAGLGEVQTQTEVLKTAEMVRKEWRLQIDAPGALSCLRSIVKREFTSPAVRFVSFGRTSFPHIATHTIGLRVVAEANRTKLVVEIALFGQGRTEVELSVAGLYSARTPIASETKRLARVLRARISA